MALCGSHEQWELLGPYNWDGIAPPDKPVGATRFVCISDTHQTHVTQQYPVIPHGDVLLHCGDFCSQSCRDEFVAFNAFLETLPHKYKFVCAGNHDWLCDFSHYEKNWQR